MLIFLAIEVKSWPASPMCVLALLTTSEGSRFEAFFEPRE